MCRTSSSVCEAVPFGVLVLDTRHAGFLGRRKAKRFIPLASLGSAITDLVLGFEVARRQPYSRTGPVPKNMMHELNMHVAQAYIDKVQMVVVHKLKGSPVISESTDEVGYAVVGSRPKGLPSFVPEDDIHIFIKAGLIGPDTLLLKVLSADGTSSYPDGTTPKKAGSLFMKDFQRSSQGLASSPADVSRALSPATKQGPPILSLVVYANEKTDLRPCADQVIETFGPINGSCSRCSQLSMNVAKGRIGDFQTIFNAGGR